MKASPNKNNFNGGETSPLLWQRQDLERYPSFMRYMRNCVASPQGPAIGRSGTRLQHKAYSDTNYSHILPFVFSDSQTNVLEFSDFRMRVLADVGLLTTGFVAATAVVSTNPLVLTSAVLAPLLVANDQVSFSGFPLASSLEGVTANVISVAGNDITFNINYSGVAGVLAGASIAKVYSIVTPYSHNDVRNLIAVQSLDVLYLFCKGYAPYVLSRYGETDWRLSVYSFVDGPYMDEVNTGEYLTPSATGNAVEVHGANAGVNGVASGSATAWQAFDADLSTVFDSGVAQTGTLTYVFNVAKVISSYTLYASRNNADVTYSAQADRPSTWVFEASVDGATNWVTLDTQYGYALWRNFRTLSIPLNNTVAYRGYRVSVLNLEELGNHNAKIAKLVLREQGSQTLQLTLSNIAALNKGQGFKATDVGRLVRVFQADAYWRSLKITAYISPTVVTVALQTGGPLLNLDRITRWRVGVFSDTTGWPVTAAFYEDRLVMGGASETPTGVAISAPQAYNIHSPTDESGAVVADNGMFFKPNTRNATPLRWISDADKGLVIGFGSSEWIISAATSNAVFSAVNAKAKRTTARGSAAVNCVQIDNQILFAQSNGRTLREYTYSFDTDSFKAPSMSLFASHLGTARFKQIAYAAEPHSIAWVRRENDTVVGLTYNREENVVGWHTHDFTCAVESIAVLPGPEAQDDLWCVTRRVINGVPMRFIEKLMPFWSFDSLLVNAYNLDCARRVKYNVASSLVYNARHLEGSKVYGIADGIPFGYEENIVVTDGAFDIGFTAKDICFGIPYEVYGETVNFEAGQGEGTSQGKTGRIHNASVAVWSTYGGEIGIQNEDNGAYEFTKMEGLYTQDGDLNDIVLYTGMVGPFNPPQGYGKKASVIFKQTKPFPFNITAIYPQMAKEDR